MTTCVSPWLLTSDWLRSYCRWQRAVDPEPRLWNRNNTIVSSSAVTPGINSLHPRGSPAPTLFSLHSLISQSLSKKYPPVIDSAVLKRSLSDSFAALRLTGDVVVQNDVSLILHAAESSQSSVKRREERKDIGLVRSASSSGYEACNNSISRRQVAKKNRITFGLVAVLQQVHVQHLTLESTLTAGLILERIQIWMEGNSLSHIANTTANSFEILINVKRLKKRL